MKSISKPLAVLFGVLVLIVAAGVIWQARSRQSSSGQRKPLYYQDSMHPWVKSDRPGKCTICSMDLTPIYEGEQGATVDPNLVVLSSNGITVLNVQTDEVKPRALSRALRVAGTIDANETKKAIISAPARGRIDTLTVDYAGVEVEEGQKLITMFSPELVQLRKTLLAVRQTGRPGGSNSLPDVFGGSDIYSGDILAPQSGVVVERNVYNGQYVAEGDRMLTIVDSSVVWFRFDVYQRQLPWFEIGQTIEVTVPGIPGKMFPAVVSFVDPTLNDATRTVKVRADIRNPVLEMNGKKLRQLKFGMYAEGLVRAEVPGVLAVPRTAILFKGGAAYAYVEKAEGAYERRRVKLGREGDAVWEVLNGLEDGDRVITSGNVLIDAQAQFAQGEEIDQGDAVEMAAALSANERGLGREARVPTITETPVSSLALSMAPQHGAAVSAPAPVAMGTNMVQRPAPAAHASAARTERMRAIMSPGGELQLLRRSAILAGRAADGISTSAPPGAQTPSSPNTAVSESSGANSAPPPASAARTDAAEAAMPPPNPVRAGTVEAYRASDQERKAVVEDMRKMRMGLIQQANRTNATAAAPAGASGASGLQAFLSVAGGISQALAADKVETFNEQVARLSPLVAGIQTQFASPHPWSELVRAVAEACKFTPATDLEGARKQFLPFSTSVVALAKQARKDDPALRAVRIYHCPMAPKPGLWVQAKGPLQNPYFGAKMLTCGEEVKQ